AGLWNGPVVGPAAADEGSPLTSTYVEGLGPDLAEAHTVEVPLVVREDARLVLGNERHLAALGLLRAPFGRISQATIKRSLGHLALRRATPQEVARGKVAFIGIATRYGNAKFSQGKGARGDGKAAIVGDLVLTEPGTGRVEGLYEIQVKGVDTGLRPVGSGPGDLHGTGAERFDEAVGQALMASYLRSNGVETTDWLAVIHYGDTIPYRNEETGATSSYESGLLVRAGNLLRIGHLQYFRNDPRRLRALFDHVNREAVRRAGQRKPMSWSRLYTHLANRKADQMAALYWARAVHGSLTMDNAGLFELVDLGTTNTVDGKVRQSRSRLSPGFGHEGTEVLALDYEDGGTLPELMGLAATGDEARDLARAVARRPGSRRFRTRMAEHALAHLGLDADDVRTTMRRD